MRESFIAKDFLGPEFEEVVNETISSYQGKHISVLEAATLELEDELEFYFQKGEDAFRKVADAMYEYAEAVDPEELDGSLFTKASETMREATKNHAKTRLRIKIIGRLRTDEMIKSRKGEEEEDE